MDKKEKVIDIISTILDKEVNEDTNYQNEKEWDSINHLQIIVTIEEEFGIKIPQEQIPMMNSVKSIIEVLNKLC